MAFREIILRRSELLAEQAARVEAHTKYMTTTAAELKVLADSERLLAAGLDIDRIERGRAVLSVHGKVTEPCRGAARYQHFASDSRDAVVADAKVDLAIGGGKLVKECLGVKNYEACGDQRCDCGYGMGPRHGSVVFSIGLTGDAREIAKQGLLTPEQIEDGLYLLTCLPAIEQALKAAA